MILAMLPKSLVMRGIAVAMIVVSSAARKMVRMSPAVTRARRNPCGRWRVEAAGVGVGPDESCLGASAALARLATVEGGCSSSITSSIVRKVRD